MNWNLVNDCKFVPLTLDGSLYALTAGTDGSFSNGTEVDTQGYDGCVFAIALGAVSASGVITARVKSTSSAGTYGSGTIDRLGADAVNESAGEGDNKWLIVGDFSDLQERYLRMSIQRTGGNVVVLSAVAILYRAGQKPAAQSSSYVTNTPQVVSNGTPSAS